MGAWVEREEESGVGSFFFWLSVARPRVGGGRRLAFGGLYLLCWPSPGICMHSWPMEQQQTEACLLACAGGRPGHSSSPSPPALLCSHKTKSNLKFTSSDIQISSAFSTLLYIDAVNPPDHQIKCCDR
jgi:hypothetical protein